MIIITSNIVLSIEIASIFFPLCQSIPSPINPKAIRIRIKKAKEKIGIIWVASAISCIDICYNVFNLNFAYFTFPIFVLMVII
jgi:hypothetical protein